MLKKLHCPITGSVTKNLNIHRVNHFHYGIVLLPVSGVCYNVLSFGYSHQCDAQGRNGGYFPVPVVPFGGRNDLILYVNSVFNIPDGYFIIKPGDRIGEIIGRHLLCVGKFILDCFNKNE